jgi:serine/threonine-protein kinase
VDADDHARSYAERRLGRVFGDRWRLVSVIGIGGMSFVYEAVHRNGRRVAVKVLHPEIGANPRSRDRFLREGYAANRVGHPGAVAVLDDGVTEDGLAFLVMELLDGESVAERAGRLGGKLPLGEAVAIGVQLLDILSCAHQAGIVHRDVKPENVFLTTTGTVKLLDFGVARIRDGVDGATALTLRDSALGTPAYMAPELARGRLSEVDARTDLWAVGATLHKVLTGAFVHDGETPNEIIVAAATLPPPSISTRAAAIPLPLASVIDRSLALSRDDRFPDAESMQRALAEAFGTALPDLRGVVAAAPEALVAETWTSRTLDAPRQALAETVATPTPARRPSRLIALAVTLVAVAIALVGRRATSVAPPTSASGRAVTTNAAPTAPAPVAAPSGPAVPPVAAPAAPAVALQHPTSQMATLPRPATPPAAGRPMDPSAPPVPRAAGSARRDPLSVDLDDPMLDRRN